ncbi:retrotransposon-like protein 1 [Perognathus longimembris pacificus]|uniref:retrotransposon-like protein 1 n=1 Tax=Perognathus longimembris pacificus TaxID=214514 RepID=UPI0020195A72|nr:retrotransposon-like protein 1 [Perognathus longimembris pacificus]
MIEPSEDSFETMMELKNPSSKQMESSEGSSNNTTVETQGSGEQAEGAGPASSPAQEREEPPSGPLQEMEEPPIDLLQDMEEPSSGPHRETEDPPNDLLQDLEESCNGDSHQALEDPLSEESEETEEGAVSPLESQEEQEDTTDLKDSEEEEEDSPEEESPMEASPEEVLAMMRSIISLFFRIHDLNEQQRVAEEILARGINAGQLPTPRSFSGDRREYREFIVLCQLILQTYPRMFYSDHLRVRYVISHLSGLALEWAEALIQQNSPVLEDFPAFLEAMSQVFEYRHALRVAEDAMFNIRQGNRCATDYINEFQSLVPTLRWPDEVLQAHLCQGLNEDIRHYLFRVPQPDSLDSLVVLILQIEDKLAERRAMLRLPPEARPRNLTWIDSPAPERWSVSSWLPTDFHPGLHRAHLFLLLLVRVTPYHSVAVQALVDSGAEGNFMDEKFAQEHYIELYEKPYPQMVQTVDGSLIGNAPIWLYTERLVCLHQNHQESIEFDIVPSPNFSVVLGINWLRLHAPEVDWARGRCTFHSPYCLKHCFRPAPPCIALEKHHISLLPGLPHPYSDLADVFNPKEADDETSDQPSSDGSDDLSESEPSELQQAGDSDRADVFFECRSSAPWVPIGLRVQEEARQQADFWRLQSMLSDTQDYVQIIPELFDQLHGATWFTKLELRGNVVEESLSIRGTEEVWKAAFGLQPQDMKSYQPFRISPNPCIPQRVIHFILQDMLGLCVLSYGPEVLVYSMSQEEHFQHVRQVLVRFRYHHIYCSLNKSQFHRHSAEILGFTLCPKGVKLNKTVMDIITDYPIPASMTSLSLLMQHMYPYRHFVEHFVIIAEPLIRKLLRNARFTWGEEDQEAFEGLKRAFRKAPRLYYPRPQNPFYLETGVTRDALYASLIQVDEQTGRKITCAFYSRNLSPLEVEYPPVEMKILSIRAAFMVWCRYLENTEEPIMILLNTEDLASLNNDRLTVLLPGHWVFFFSHFRFDVAEMPEDDGSPSLTGRSRGWRALGGGRSLRPLLLLAMRSSLRNRSSDSESDSDEDSEEDLLNQQTLIQELLSMIPIDQILNSFLAHFSMAQIRAVILHFFRGLLYWKNLVALSALLVLLRVRRQLSLPPARAMEAAWPPPRPSLRLILDSSLVAGSGMASAIAQLLGQMPPLVGANTVPAQELAELFLGPGRWQRNALHSQVPRGLWFTPGFWLTLCACFGVRVTPLAGDRPIPLRSRPLELRVVGDEDVVLREALQDDLQSYRQCGLHDGLQDTSQDEQQVSDEEERESPPPEGAAGAPPLRPRSLMDPEVLDFLSNRLLYVRGADGRLHLLDREQVARALTRFLTMVYTGTLPAPASGAAPREGARLEELPHDGDEDLD